MVSYINVHAILDARRRFAKASTSNDPESSQVLFFDIQCYCISISAKLKHLVLKISLKAGTSGYCSRAYGFWEEHIDKDAS